MSGQKAKAKCDKVNDSFFVTRLDLNITNLYISGTNTFEIIASVYNSDTQEYYLHLNSPKSQVLGSYSLYSKVNVGGFPISFTGQGYVDLTAEDSRTVIKFVFGKNIENGNLKMENLTFSDIATGNFDSRITGFMDNEIYSDFLNSVLESVTPLAQTELIQQLIAPYAEETMNSLNPLLGLFQSVDELTEQLVKFTGPMDTGFLGEPLCTKY